MNNLSVSWSALQVNEFPSVEVSLSVPVQVGIVISIVLELSVPVTVIGAP